MNRYWLDILNRYFEAETTEEEERLLKRFPMWAVKLIANRYNSLFTRLGDQSPNFIAAIGDLTARRMARFNERVPDMPGVKYRSVMSVMLIFFINNGSFRKK